MQGILSPSAIQRDAIPLNATPSALGHGGETGLLGRTEHELYVLQRQTPNPYSDYQSLTAYNAKVAEVDQIKRRMEERVRDKLVRRDAVAIGFSDDAGPDADREVIPAEFWRFADIDFMGDAARYRDRGYRSILVAVCLPRHFVTANVPPIEETPPAEATPEVAKLFPPKMGAPSMEEHRARAIEIASSRDPTLLHLPYKEAKRLLEPVLDEIRPSWRHERGFTDKSLQAHIRKLRQAKRLI